MVASVAPYIAIHVEVLSVNLDSLDSSLVCNVYHRKLALFRGGSGRGRQSSHQCLGLVSGLEGLHDLAPVGVHVLALIQGSFVNVEEVLLVVRVEILLRRIPLRGGFYLKLINWWLCDLSLRIELWEFIITKLILHTLLSSPRAAVDAFGL